MDLLLHSSTGTRELSRYYQQAFNHAVELFIVTAYLTDWDPSLKLNPKCCSFRIIIGRDFGITRKAACKEIMRSLPRKRKAQFLVADRISGFHPKALFWREENGLCFGVVGSSNLTQAAFKTNYEANIFTPLSEADYLKAKQWVRNIEKQSVVVSEDWLRKYNEAPLQHNGASGTKTSSDAMQVVALKPPTPPGMSERLAARRANLAAYEKKRTGLMRLFRRCANEEINSKEFFDQLPKHWSFEAGDRFQGAGWERQGKASDFKELSKSFLRILDAPPEDRDDAVAEEIDRLAERKVPTRRAFLSEMLCLRFPDEYPVLAKPVMDYLKTEKFKAPRASSEGARFIHLAKTLRSSLLDNPNHPAKNLAELDTVIWVKFGKKKN